MRLVWLGVACLGLLSGCAPISKKVQIDLNRADALVLEGCYDCLIQARDIYLRAAVAKARPLVLSRLFEVELLMTLRERELALDSSASLMRAKALVREFPPTVEAERYVKIVGAIPIESVGWARSEQTRFRFERRAFMPSAAAEIAWLEQAALGHPFRQYLALSIWCGWPATGAATVSWFAVSPTAPKLPAFKNAQCRRGRPGGMAALRVEAPTFVDVAVILAEAAVANVQRDGGTSARALLAEAYARFPLSPAVTHLSGSFNQTIGDCTAALRYYDETLALQPRHEDAWLGRTMCLAFVHRFDEAIAAATRMIELNTDNIALAYYWRAFVLHELKQLDRARVDIERAKALGRGESIYTLAGIIEFEQDALDQADPDLRTAKALNFLNLNCTASWYLGLVQLKRQRFADAGGHFQDAMICFDRLAIEDARIIDSMRAREGLDPDFQARQIAGFEAALAENRRQQCAAALNAASNFVYAGDTARARGLLDIAARDPGLKEKVEELRKFIKGM